MKQFSLLSLTFLLTTLFCFNSQAQKAPMKFGKVEKENLAMTECSIDKDANAMIISDYGTIGLNYDAEGSAITEFYRHVRIKIFNKEGYEWGNVTIPFYERSASSREKITLIKAASYHLEGNKVITTKMNAKEAVHEEQITKTIYLKKFAIPNVKEGSIIEYSYKITSDFIFNLQNWEFQKEIPVKWSEYRATFPKGFDYQKILRGNPNFSIQTSTPTAQIYTGSSLQTEATMHRWVAENMKGLIEEPFNASAKDYATQVEFQLKSYTSPSGRYQSFAVDYNSFNDNVWNRYGYKEIFTGIGNAYIKKRVPSIIEGKEEAIDKAITLYEHVKNHMANKGNSMSVTAQSLRAAYEEGEGRAGDINLILAVMLKEAGINVYPVILGTRSIGQPHPIYPNQERFNYVVLLVEIDGSTYYADAANSNSLPFGMLPKKCLNGRGWLVNPTSPKWVGLQGGAKSNSVVFANLTINEEGQLTGKVDLTLKSYEALDIRGSKTGADDEKIAEYLKKELDEWEVSDVSWENKKAIYQPLKLSFNLQQELEDPDMIYFNPSVFGLEDENPFTNEERNLPVDFPYAQGRKYVLSFTMPEGYVIDDLPKPTRVSLPNKGGSFTFNVSQNGQTITLINHLKLNQKFFTVEEYKGLRKFYEMVVAKNAEQIVIKKTTE